MRRTADKWQLLLHCCNIYFFCVTAFTCMFFPFEPYTTYRRAAAIMTAKKTSPTKRSRWRIKTEKNYSVVPAAAASSYSLILYIIIIIRVYRYSRAMTCSYAHNKNITIITYLPIIFFKNLLFSSANLLYLFNNLSNLIILTERRAEILRKFVGLAGHASRQSHQCVMWPIADRLLIRF